MLVVELIHRFHRVVALPFVGEVVPACIRSWVQKSTAVDKGTLGAWLPALDIGDASGEFIALNLLKGTLVKVS